MNLVMQIAEKMKLHDYLWIREGGLGLGQCRQISSRNRHFAHHQPLDRALGYEMSVLEYSLMRSNLLVYKRGVVSEMVQIYNVRNVLLVNIIGLLDL